MIPISKEESQKIRKYFPTAAITRTCRQKSKRHHYYLPEVENYLELIKDSNSEAAAVYPKVAKYNNWKNKKYGNSNT